jgi:hypothetical protein
MALDNIGKRIDLAWGERARLETREADGRFTAMLRAPISD